MGGKSSNWVIVSILFALFILLGIRYVSLSRRHSRVEHALDVLTAVAKARRHRSTIHQYADSLESPDD